MSLPLHRASRLGFGTYRWTGTRTQTRALLAALDAGCSLVDTAPTYSSPEVRPRLGEALRARREEVFVVSKGGYREGGYCLEPGFLRRRIQQEAHDVGGGRLDAFLLHNPEHLRDADPTADVLGPLEAAFAVCEEQVAAGTLGCYGVSSNVVAHPHHPLGQRLVPVLVGLAAGVDFDHHLRVLQFPFNLVERDALAGAWLEECRSLGLTVIGNRPLSPITPDGPRRVADLPEAPPRPSVRVLEELGRCADIGWLAALWDQVASPDALDLVVGLLGRRVDPEDALVRSLAAELVAVRRVELRRAAALACEPLVERARLDGLLPGRDDDSVVLRACRGYLDSVDHVLVGLRTPEDVAALAPLMGPGRLVSA